MIMPLSPQDIQPLEETSEKLSEVQDMIDRFLMERWEKGAKIHFEVPRWVPQHVVNTIVSVYRGLGWHVQERYYGCFWDRRLDLVFSEEFRFKDLPSLLGLNED
jgi:hypothetical protein